MYFFLWLKRTVLNESNTSSKARAMNKKHGRNWGHNYDPDAEIKPGFQGFKHMPENPPKALSKEEQAYFHGFEDVELGPTRFKESEPSVTSYDSQIRDGAPKGSQDFFTQAPIFSKDCFPSSSKESRSHSRSVSPGPYHSSPPTPPPYATREPAYPVSTFLSRSATQGHASQPTTRGSSRACSRGSSRSASQGHTLSTSQGLARSASVGHSGTPSRSSLKGPSLSSACEPSRSASTGHRSSKE